MGIFQTAARWGYHAWASSKRCCGVGLGARSRNVKAEEREIAKVEGRMLGEGNGCDWGYGRDKRRVGKGGSPW